MKIFENPNADLGFKILIGIISFLGLRKVFSQSDGKPGFSHHDFKTMFAFALFVWAFIYVMVKEGSRSHEYPLYSDTLMAFIITGLFSVLHMDKVLLIFKDLLTLLIQLRTKTSTTKSVEVKESTTTKEKVEEIA